MIKRNISGVLLLDKPYGISSNKALQIVKYLYSAEKSGHTGTLDPMATGVLPICIGEATKFSSYLLNTRKSYEAVLKLGFLSTTGDVEGEIEKISDLQEHALSIQDCQAVLGQFLGEIQQLPPMYSALKHQGKPLYAYARKGENVERKSRTVFIYDLRAKLLKENELTITVQCGSGTYIRTLAEDIGKALGCGGAYLVKLTRTSVGKFELSQSLALKALETMNAASRDDCLLPVDSMLSDIPLIVLDKKESKYLLQGRVLSARSIAGSFENVPEQNEKINCLQDFRLYYQQQFLGLGEMSNDLRLKPKRLLLESFLLSLNSFPIN